MDNAFVWSVLNILSHNPQNRLTVSTQMTSPAFKLSNTMLKRLLKHLIGPPRLHMSRLFGSILPKTMNFRQHHVLETLAWSAAELK